MYSFPLAYSPMTTTTPHGYIAAAIADHLSEVQAVRSPKTNRDQPSRPHTPTKSDNRGTWELRDNGA
jgi:hypothetical protein